MPDGGGCLRPERRVVPRDAADKSFHYPVAQHRFDPGDESLARCRPISSCRGESREPRFATGTPFLGPRTGNDDAYAVNRSYEPRSACVELEVVELGGIEPPSIRHRTPVLRPFPTSSLTQGDRRVSWPPVARWPATRLSEWSSVFPDASGLFRCHPPLLVPGCGGSAPCAISGHDVSSLT